MVTTGGQMKNFKKLFVSLSWMTIFSVALGAAWTTKRLTYNSTSSYDPAVAVNGANVYVVWSDSWNGDIFFKRSADAGATWQASKRLKANDGYSGHPRIAVNGANIYVTWVDQTSGNDEIYFNRSGDNGATWQSTKRLTFNSGYSLWPQIAISDVNPCVVWQDDTPGDNVIDFRKSLDGGATWQSARQLTNYPGSSMMPDIVGDGANLYVVYAGLFSASWEVYFRRSLDGGATWQSQKRLTYNAGGSSNAKIAISGANLFVVWEDDTPGNNDIYFKKSTDQGVTWQTIKNLTNNAGGSYSPEIAASGANVYVTWYDDTSGNNEIYVRKSVDGGETWQSSQRLTNDADDSLYPDIAVSGANVYVAWQDTASGNAEIYVKFSPL